MKKKKKYNDEYLKDYQSNIIEHKNDLWIPKINATYKTLNINTWFNIEETTNRNKYEKLNKSEILNKSETLNKSEKLNKSKFKKIINSIKLKKIKLNNDSICTCHKCISLQRRHKN